MAGYAKYTLNPKSNFAVRYEYSRRPHGYTGVLLGAPGFAQEFTGTYSYNLTSGLLVRGEYRYDFGQQPIFQSGPTNFVKEQNTVVPQLRVLVQQRESEVTQPRIPELRDRILQNANGRPESIPAAVFVFNVWSRKVKFECPGTLADCESTPGQAQRKQREQAPALHTERPFVGEGW